MDKEKYAEMLHQMAARRYGEERANSLQRAIQEMARCIMSVTEFAVPPEEEPAFFS